MLLKVMTVYNRVDGCCEQIMTARTEARFVREFVEGCEARNKQLAEKHYPQISLIEYEIRCVGDFEDVTGEITPCTPRVVPFSLGRSGITEGNMDVPVPPVVSPVVPTEKVN